MDPLFSKLYYKDGKTMVVLHPPVVFKKHLKTIPPEYKVVNKITPDQPIEFIIVFSSKKDEVIELLKSVIPCLIDDAVFWLAYPKGTSKKYSCDFNRDTCWEIYKPYQLLPVHQIAVDDDWSALRFRKIEYVKSTVRKQQ